MSRASPAAAPSHAVDISSSGFSARVPPFRCACGWQVARCAADPKQRPQRFLKGTDSQKGRQTCLGALWKIVGAVPSCGRSGHVAGPGSGGKPLSVLGERVLVPDTGESRVYSLGGRLRTDVFAHKRKNPKHDGERRTERMDSPLRCSLPCGLFRVLKVRQRYTEIFGRDDL